MKEHSRPLRSIPSTFEIYFVASSHKSLDCGRESYAYTLSTGRSFFLCLYVVYGEKNEALFAAADLAVLLDE